MKTLGILIIGILIISVCFYQYSVEASDAQDYYETGSRYYRSLDYAEALKWYRKSADQGEAIGQTQLGFMYYFGQGVSKNLTEAKKWFHKAALQGNEEALEMMKLLKEKGF